MEQSEITKTLRVAGQTLEALERMYKNDPAVQTLAVTGQDLVACLTVLLERVERLEEGR